MMKIEDYYNFIINGNIPNGPPEMDDLLFHPQKLSYDFHLTIDLIQWRHKFTEHGIWCLVYNEWLEKLAKYINGRSVLEIMAGSGLIAYGLSQFDVKIRATDNFSWQKAHRVLKNYYPVIIEEAIESVKNSKQEVLLISWPPYNDSIIEEIGELWGKERPIIIIGECGDGCTGTEEFWNNLTIEEEIEIQSWPGIHDNIYIAFFKKDL